MEDEYEFDKYVTEGAYHWRLAHNRNLLRRQLKSRSLYNIVCDHIEKNINLQSTDGIDVGCGDGAFMYTAVRRGANIVGIDLSHSGLAAGRQEFRRRLSQPPTMMRADATCLPFRDPFDYAVAIELIEHLEEPTALLRSVAENLQPDGIFVCTTPHRQGDELRDHRHVREFTVQELTRLLSEQFGDVEVLGYYPEYLDSLLQTPTPVQQFNRLIRVGTRLGSYVWNPYRRLSTQTPDESWRQLVAVCKGT